MSKRFIIETDLGHDPDDILAICHLVEAGHTIAGIGLVPGAPEQVKLATGLRRSLNMDFPVGVSKLDAKQEKVGVHDTIIKTYGWRDTKHDGLSQDVFRSVFEKEPDVSVLIIGPAPGIGKVAHLCKKEVFFQGGFLPYNLHQPTVVVDKFVGQEAVPTFNFNGDRKAVDAILAADCKRRFCGKNVCHRVLMTKDKIPLMAPARTIAGQIYCEVMRLYFQKHSEKKLHDPTALVCCLHPEIATWFLGRPIRVGGRWSTVPDENGDSILADVNDELLWQHLLKRT